MTLTELIDRLAAHRDAHGGDCQVVVVTDERRAWTFDVRAERGAPHDPPLVVIDATRPPPSDPATDRILSSFR